MKFLRTVFPRGVRARAVVAPLATVALLVGSAGVLAPSASASLASSHHVQPATHRAPHHHAPMATVLLAKPRLAPAHIHKILTVNNFGDNPAQQSCTAHNNHTCSLRAAINAANADVGFTDEIVSPTGKVITLSQHTTLNVTNSMVIQATGDTVVGNNTFQIFNVNNNASVSIVGLKIEKGYATFGGGLDCVTGSLLLDGVTFTQNAAATKGGAVYSGYSCALWVTNSVFTSNSALDTSSGEGGALWIFGNASISHTTIGGSTNASGNHAISGAGIYNWDAVTNISNCVIEHNSPTAGYYGYGVGIYNDEAMTISNSTIMNNSAPNGVEGAGVYNSYFMTIDNTNFVGNSAGGSATSYGTALYYEGDTLDMTNVNFSGTLTVPAMGYDIYGGVIYDESSSSSFVWNGGKVSNTTNGIQGRNNYVEGGVGYFDSNNTTVTNVSVANTVNRALVNEGVEGGVFYFDNYAHVSGITIANTTNSGYYVYGGAIYANSDGLLSGITITKTSNVASYATGSYIYGGAVYIDGSYGGINGLTVTNTKDITNLAGTATPSTTSTYVYGGALYNDGSEWNMKNVTFSGGTVSAQGGSSYIEGGAIYTDNNSVSANVQVLGFKVTADNYIYGGLFYSDDELGINGLTLGDSTIRVLGSSLHTAPYADGSFLYEDSPISMTNGTIANNSAQVAGTSGYNDAIWTSGPGMFMNDTIANNAVFGATPSLLTPNSDNLTLRNSIVSSVFPAHNCRAIGGLIVSGGSNIDNGNSCHFKQLGDMKLTNAKVLALANNGGPVWTAALSPLSPAINHASSVGCPATDARGVKRPQGGACDIGAYEAAKK